MSSGDPAKRTERVDHVRSLICYLTCADNRRRVLPVSLSLFLSVHFHDLSVDILGGPRTIICRLAHSVGVYRLRIEGEQ
jgi:hypothetical protein